MCGVAAQLRSSPAFRLLRIFGSSGMNEQDCAEDEKDGLKCLVFNGVVYFPVFPGEIFKILDLNQKIQETENLTLKMDSKEKINPSHSLKPPPYLCGIGRYMDINPFLDFLFLPDSYFL